MRETSRVSDAGAAAAPRRVLLIEPYEPVRTLVEAVMRQAGYDVASCPDGRSAIEALEVVEFFSCVVVGSPVHMEAEEGNLLFLEYIERHCPNWRPCLVVVTTWVESERLLSLASRMHVCAVLAKPFAPRDLLAAMGSCICRSSEPTRWFGIRSALVSSVTGSPPSTT